MLQFNEKRATQTAAQFLKLAGGHLRYMVLIKFLYLADREALLKWGTPLTGDTYKSMRWGPLLSRTHDLITEELPESEAALSFWKGHIEKRDYDVVLRSDPGNDELSEVDEELITRVFDQFFAKYRDLKYDPFAFCNFLHTILPEYKTAQEGESFPLDHHDILVAGKKQPEEILEIEYLLASIGQMQRLR
ncbi:MAG: Panacea domain-containing protein [Candidatus Acidiferrum sp.]